MCFDFSFFFRVEASVPDASERLGEPGRLREREDEDLVNPPASKSLPLFSLRPDGVFAPEERMPVFFPSASSSFFKLASRSRSMRSRSSSESVYISVSLNCTCRQKSGNTVPMIHILNHCHG